MGHLGCRRDDEGMSTLTQSPHADERRPAGRGVLVGGGLVLISALLFGMILAARGNTEYPPDSPEAAAQAYVQALFDRDPEKARTRLAPEISAQCIGRGPYSWRVRANDAVRFDDVRLETGRAEIDLVFTTRATPDPFDLPIPDTPYGDRRWTLVLERRTDGWFIVDGGSLIDGCNER